MYNLPGIQKMKVFTSGDSVTTSISLLQYICMYFLLVNLFYKYIYLYYITSDNNSQLSGLIYDKHKLKKAEQHNAAQLEKLN